MIEVWKPKSRSMLEHRFPNEWANFVKLLERGDWVSVIYRKLEDGCGAHLSNLFIT